MLKARGRPAARPEVDLVAAAAEEVVVATEMEILLADQQRSLESRTGVVPCWRRWDGAVVRL